MDAIPVYGYCKALSAALTVLLRASTALVLPSQTHLLLLNACRCDRKLLPVLLDLQQKVQKATKWIELNHDANVEV